MKVAGAILSRTWLYRLAGRTARFVLPLLPRWLIYNQLNAWGRQRELPIVPAQSFRQMYRKRKHPPPENEAT